MVDAAVIIRGEDKSAAAFRKAKKNVGALTQSIKGLVGAYAAFRVVTKVIDIHRKFGAAISDLAAITGAAGKDLEFFRQKSKEFGETTTLSASQAAAAFKLVASAKPDLLENADALATVTREVITLSEASGTELTDAAKTVGSALNQFSADADEAARFVNVLAAGAKFGASEITDTSEALEKAGLVASAAGTSFEETNAAIQALSTVALKGSEAGTGLRNVYLNLAKQTKDEFKPELVGLTQALKNLQDANLNTNELLDIFGKKNIVAARALIKTADNVENLTKKLTGTNVAYEQAAIKVDNLDGDIKRMNSAWEAAAIAIGETLDPALRSIVQIMTDTAKIVKTVDLAFRDFQDGIGATAAAITAALSGNFSQMKEIIDLRQEQVALNNKELESIWNKNEATETALTKEEQLAAAQKSRAESQAKFNEQQAALAAKKVSDENIAIEEANIAFEISEQNKLMKLQETLLTEEELIGISYANRFNQIQELRFANVINQEEANELMLENEKRRITQEDKLRKKSNKDEHQRRNMLARATLSTSAQILSTLASMQDTSSKRGFERAKKYQIAAAVIGTAGAVINALNTQPFIVGIVMAVLAAAAGAAQISKIQSTKFGGGAGGAASIPSASSISVPKIPDMGGQVVTAERAPRQVNITFEGEGPVSQEWIRDKLIPGLNDAIGDGVEIDVAA